MTPDLPPVLPPIGAELKFTKTHFQSNEIAGSIVKVISHGPCGRFFETTSNSYPTRNVIRLDGWNEGLELVVPIARANGIGGEEIPAGLPPLPPVPEGYDHWVYRGRGWKTERPAMYSAFSPAFRETEWHDPMFYEEVGGIDAYHYIEAVKEPTSDPCESESPKPDEVPDEMPSGLPSLPVAADGHQWIYRGPAHYEEEILPPARFAFATVGMTQWYPSRKGSRAHHIHVIESVPEPSPPKPEGEMHVTNFTLDSEDEVRAFLAGAAIAAERTVICQQTSLINVEVRYSDNLTTDLAAARSENEKLRIESEKWRTKFLTQRDEANSNTWIWMGDGEDHPESLTCPVIMSADQLREFVAAKESEQRLRAALEEIAKQPLWSEMDKEDQEGSDFEGGYDMCIETARTALAPASSGKGEG